MTKSLILVIGDRLSQEEETLNSGPFSGPYSYQFKSWLNTVQPIYYNCSDTKAKPILSQAAQLTVKNKINSIQPAGILACGRFAGEVLGLITNPAKDEFDNSETHLFNYNGIPVVITPHPRESMIESYYPQHIQFGINKLINAINGYKEPAHINHHDLGAVFTAAKAIKPGDVVCLDIETPKMKSRDDLKLRSIAFSTDGINAYVISPDLYGQNIFEEFLQHIVRAIENPSVTIVGQNIFFDLSVLNQIYGVFVKGPVHCTMQVENLLNYQFPKSLNDLAKRYLAVSPWKGGYKFSGHELREYNCLDVIYTFRIYQKQTTALHTRGLWNYFSKYRLPLFEATFHMAMTGMVVDTDLRSEYQKEVQEALVEPLKQFNETVLKFIHLVPPKETVKKTWDVANDIRVPNINPTPAECKALKGDSWKKYLYGCGINKDLAPDYYIVKKAKAKLYGWTVGQVNRKVYKDVSTFTPYEAINPKSPNQLKLLFASMDIPKVRVRQASTKKYVMDSTSSDALRKILATKPTTEDQSNVLISLLAYRELEKVLGTYYSMPLDPGGIWRYSYNQDGADTGRSTSSMTSWGTGGNSQNLPSRTKNEVLKRLKFKNLIIPRPGRLFFTPDQASAESVVVAYLSNCQIMIDEFNKPEPDFHRIVAKLCYEFINPGKRFDDLDSDLQKQLRNDSKAISHGASYGMFVDTLRESYFKATGKFVGREEIQALLNAWHLAFKEIKSNWHNDVKHKVKNGEVWSNCFGRQYYFSGVEDFNSLQEMLAKEPQGLVPDITNQMVLWAYRHLVVETNKGAVVQHGHDAFLCEVDADYIETFVPLFFEQASKLSLSFPTGNVVMKWDGQIGDRWGNVIKYSKWLNKQKEVVNV
jgi:DNA polymerase I-like protein with 3'-5' exonuclease and polymerase domains